MIEYKIVKSDLPFGSEFSPSQIDLAEVLEIARQSKDWREFEKAVRLRYFETHKTSDYNRAKLANNCKLGMIAYGIIDRNAQLTDFGFKLYSLKEDKPKLYRELAKHILLNRFGLVLVQCIQDMQQGGEPVNLQSLRTTLEERGIHFPRGGKHPSIMKLWLEQAGIFKPNSWQVDEGRLQEILGSPLDEFDKVAQLSREQKAFLKALSNLGGQGVHKSSDLEKLAAASYGVKFNEKNLPKQVLYPLKDLGFIELTRGTKESGRGAKPFLVRPTSKFVGEIMEPILVQLEKQVGGDLRPMMRRPLGQILVDLRSKEKHLRGLALEALAFKLMRLLDLNYIATRLRGRDTGGAEVDLIFEGLHLVFSRWQIQCKNTSRVNLDDVAKEVGLASLLRSQVIVMVSTGTAGSEARKYANHIMSTSNLDIVFVEGEDIEAIKTEPAAIVDIMKREAKRAMEIKKLDVEKVLRSS